MYSHGHTTWHVRDNRMYFLYVYSNIYLSGAVTYQEVSTCKEKHDATVASSSRLYATRRVGYVIYSSINEVSLNQPKQIK
jgi:hypothetical protein